MQPSQLSATGGNGSQTSTQNPQTASPGNISPGSSSSIQALNSVNLFNGQNGVSLNPTPLPTVNLNTTTTQPTATPKTTVANHHINGALLGFSIVLFILAVAMFWFTSKGANKTTI